MALLLELGHYHIEVESDSLLAIQALRSGKRGSSEFNFIDDVLDLACSFHSVVWSILNAQGTRLLIC